MYEWKKVILKSNDTMKDAIRALNEEALRIVMIEDDQKKLLGTITDGDIRRALTEHMDMTSELSQIMHVNPISISTDITSEQILLIMQKNNVMQLPIVDKKGKIIGLKTLQNIHEIQKYDNTVFLMAGGFGKRLMPLTNDIPKPLLKVGTKPILEIILSQFIESGFHKFVISTHYKAQMLKDYFGDGAKWGVSISYVYEEDPLGTAGSLGLIPKINDDLPIIVMNGDLLTKVDFETFLDFHNKKLGVASICVREYDLKVPYGVVESSNQSLISIKEKPVHKFFINAGIYILNQSLLKSLKGKNYLDMPTLLESQLNKGLEVNVFPVHEYWLDIGQIEQFKQAEKESNIFQ